MDLVKSIEFFNPIMAKNEEIHIIGVGAIGSFIALTLIKLGVESLYIWDFDTVEAHNITNQVYDNNDIGKTKVNALEEHLLRINPNIRIHKKGKYLEQPLKGIIFLTVDSIKVRKKFLKDNILNPFINLVIDARIGLDKGQVITTNWLKQNDIENHISLSCFNENEVDAPVSACGTTLSVAPTVIIAAQYAIAQFINYHKKFPTPQLIQFDAFNFKTIAK